MSLMDGSQDQFHMVHPHMAAYCRYFILPAIGSENTVVAPEGLIYGCSLLSWLYGLYFMLLEMLGVFVVCLTFQFDSYFMPFEMLGVFVVCLTFL